MSQAIHLKFSVKLLVLFLVCLLTVNLMYLGSPSSQATQDFNRPPLEARNGIQNKSRHIINEFKNRYPNLLDCTILDYEKWADDGNELAVDVNNSLYVDPAPAHVQDMRITRGVIVYFPVESVDNYEYEFRWMYRSWAEMQKSESPTWRTDLVVFIDRERLTEDIKLFDQLNCSFAHKRRDSSDLPMCALVDYVPLRFRNITVDRLLYEKLSGRTTNKISHLYSFFFNQFDIFKPHERNLNIFYHYLLTRLRRYLYTDSILIAFDGHEYFEQAGYTFLIRSDMDIFLTPLFAKWSPKYCNDFYVGRGEYSNSYNMKKMERIAGNMGFDFAKIKNLGSTWFSTSNQFKFVSYLTLISMGYLSEEEFSPNERDGKVGETNWPYWHYGVLLLYGQQLAMNHLISNRETNIIKLNELIDAISISNGTIDQVLHIHVFHGSYMFSKFQFKRNKYDYLRNETASMDTNQIKFYSLNLALEGKFLSLGDLNSLFKNQTNLKI